MISINLVNDSTLYSFKPPCLLYFIQYIELDNIIYNWERENHHKMVTLGKSAWRVYENPLYYILQCFTKYDMRRKIQSFKKWLCPFIDCFGMEVKVNFLQKWITLLHCLPVFVESSLTFVPFVSKPWILYPFLCFLSTFLLPIFWILNLCWYCYRHSKWILQQNKDACHSGVRILARWMGRG